MNVLALLIAIPMGIELIAALYGPIDLAYRPRLMWRAVLRLTLVTGIAAGLALWLGALFLVGLGSIAVIFVIKHWLVAFAYRLPADYKRPIWTSEQAKKIPGDK